MLLKLLSVPELNFYSSFKNGLSQIQNMSKFEKSMTFFWLLGPFIYLIERDPADIWLTLIGVIFLIRCIKRKEWGWCSQLWFRSSLALWGFGLFSAITSPDPIFSFQQGFVWIRFPLYVAAAQVWLAKDRDIRVMMLLSMLIGMLIMCSILIAEIIIEPKARLTWPYGDKVPGGYIGKFSLPLFCILMAIAVSKKSTSSIISGIIGLLSIGISVLTGERTNFLIRACGGILASIIWKPKLVMFSMLVLVEVFAVILVFFHRPDLNERFLKEFANNIPLVNTQESNPYWGAWRGGIQQALITPIKGIGPSGTRKTCKNLDKHNPSWLPGKNYCGNHPHNFYIQLFSEIGVLGLLFGCVMFVSLIITCFKARVENLNCPMAATAFVVPFAFFFPIQQFGSFYGQWGNLFIWFAIGFAVSQYQSWEKSKKTSEK